MIFYKGMKVKVINKRFTYVGIFTKLMNLIPIVKSMRFVREKYPWIHHEYIIIDVFDPSVGDSFYLMKNKFVIAIKDLQTGRVYLVSPDAIVIDQS